MSKTPVNDMFSATPAALAKMRTARNDLNLDTSPLLQTPPALRGGAADAASLAPAFADMMSASPAQLAKMRAASAASPLSNGHAQVHANGHANGAMGSPVSPAPQTAFAEMFGGSPADLAAMRDAVRSRANEPPGGDALHRIDRLRKHLVRGFFPLVAPADPTRFDAMFAASPAHLSSMRSAAGAGASPYGAAGGASLDPSRFDDMFAASPAHLSAMRARRPGRLAFPSGTTRRAAAREIITRCPWTPTRRASRWCTTWWLATRARRARKSWPSAWSRPSSFPAALVPEGTWIREHVVGRLEKLEKGAGLRGSWRCEASYHADTAGGEITQLINVVFGNTSMKEGVMVADLRLPPAVLAEYPGPRFGVEGLRRAVGVPRGPMIMTALKPMGSSTAELAKMAYAFAKGASTSSRTTTAWRTSPGRRTMSALRRAPRPARANAETGRRCIYAPCVCARRTW